MTQGEFLTGAEVAAQFRISESTLTRLVKDGKIRGYRFGPRIFRYRPADVEQYLESVATVPEVAS